MTSRPDTNMKHRYFYTDPLAAAWMTRHFDMQLYLGSYPDDFDSYGPGNWRHCQDDWVYRQEKLGHATPRFYFHPDSLQLLEPKAGDLLQGAVVLDRPGLRVVDSNDPEDLEAAKTLMSRGMKIIQRDGKPFHWPESEAA